MATSNLVTQSYGDVLLECGSGSPDHTSPKGSLYVDLDKPVLHVNTDGAVDWGVLGRNDFVSTDQVITTAGSLALAHGLGVVPTHFDYFLICQVAEFGYSIGDIVVVDSIGVFVQNTFMSITVDSTNIKVRYGSAVDVFRLLNKNTGAGVTATDANWKLRIIAS